MLASAERRREVCALNRLVERSGPGRALLRGTENLHVPRAHVLGDWDLGDGLQDAKRRAADVALGGIAEEDSKPTGCGVEVAKTRPLSSSDERAGMRDARVILLSLDASELDPRDVRRDRELVEDQSRTNRRRLRWVADKE